MIFGASFLYYKMLRPFEGTGQVARAPKGFCCRSDQREVIVSDGKIPATPGIRFLRDQGVPFRLHPYRYEDKGGARHSSRELGVGEHEVIKTLIMEDELKRPLLLLMPGDRQASTKTLARIMGVKAIQPCEEKTAERHTGYKFGGTSPFGTRRSLPVYLEESILSLPRIFINAGRRGLLAELSPVDLARVLQPTLVTVAI